MQFKELTLSTNQLADLRAWYQDVLGLPLLMAADEKIAFQAGDTRLEFQQAVDGFNGAYHFAFNIPENQFRQARSWLRERTALLSDEKGLDEFYSEVWDAHMLYARDPMGNIIELIARHTLSNETDEPFTPDQILCVSELGLASDHVVKTVEELVQVLDEPIYSGPGSAEFSSVGDEQGLLVVVKVHRLWMPDWSLPADFVPFTAVLETRTGLLCELRAPSYPFQVRAQASGADGLRLEGTEPV